MIKAIRAALAVMLAAAFIVAAAAIEGTEAHAASAEICEEEAGTWESLGVWKLTAYCPLECCNGRGRAWQTASGAEMVVGRTVAAAHFPFGTKLKINGHVYVVEDRGVTGKHVDILFPTHAAGNEFGIQYAEVFILR